VEVTGSQYPSFAAGYGNEGSDQVMMREIYTLCDMWRKNKKGKKKAREQRTTHDVDYTRPPIGLN
jgi:hypothetical protein